MNVKFAGSFVFHVPGSNTTFENRFHRLAGLDANDPDRPLNPGIRYVEIAPSKLDDDSHYFNVYCEPEQDRDFSRLGWQAADVAMLHRNEAPPGVSKGMPYKKFMALMEQHFQRLIDTVMTPHLKVLYGKPIQEQDE